MKSFMGFVGEIKILYGFGLGSVSCAGLLAGVRGRCKGRVMQGVQSTGQVADFVVPPWCCRQGVGGSVTRQGVGGCLIASRWCQRVSGVSVCLRLIRPQGVLSPVLGSVL